MIIQCVHCKEEIEVDDDWAGLAGKCPNCDERIQIPGQRKPMKMLTKIKWGIVACIALFALYVVTPFNKIFSSKDLTHSKVQRCFKKMTGLKDGSVRVVGVRAGQGFGGFTIADVNLTNFQWRDGDHSQPPYTGPATAIFTGYTDGRWTLKEVELTGTTDASGAKPQFSPNVDSY